MVKQSIRMKNYILSKNQLSKRPENERTIYFLYDDIYPITNAELSIFAKNLKDQI